MKTLNQLFEEAGYRNTHCKFSETPMGKALIEWLTQKRQEAENEKLTPYLECLDELLEELHQ